MRIPRPVLAYLEAYKKLVTQLGGLPANAAAAARGEVEAQVTAERTRVS
jgi:hypothetical protein